MTSFQTCFIIFIVTLTNISCNSKSHDNTNNSEAVRIEIKPAFQEHSEIGIFKKDTVTSIQILLMNYQAPTIPIDTFWYKKINLTGSQLISFSHLINLCKEKIGHKRKVVKGVDGITISSTYVAKGDTNLISFWSPRKDVDSSEYNLADNIFEIVPSLFQDSLLTEYFEEMKEYIDESKIHHADPRRPIDQLRMRKYHWTIRK